MDLAVGIISCSSCGVRDFKSIDDEMRFQFTVSNARGCEEYSVQREAVWLGKRDLPIHRRHTCRVCKITFRHQLPEIANGFRMTRRVHEYAENEFLCRPYTYGPARAGLDVKTGRASSVSTPGSWGSGAVWGLGFSLYLSVGRLSVDKFFPPEIHHFPYEF